MKMAYTKYLRLLTYVLLGAALWVGGRLSHVIPVSLNSPRWIAADAAREANKEFAGGPDILTCTRSGHDVAARAQAALSKRRLDAYCAPVPRVKLRMRDGRVQWVLAYARPDPAPGESYTVTVVVDDLTGDALIESS
jgi:hypothetical protein